MRKQWERDVERRAKVNVTITNARAKIRDPMTPPDEKNDNIDILAKLQRNWVNAGKGLDEVIKDNINTYSTESKDRARFRRSKKR